MNILDMVSLAFIEGISICIISPIVGYVVVRAYYKHKGEWHTKDRDCLT